MLQHHLPTLVNDRRLVREAAAERRRLLKAKRRVSDPHRRPALTLAAPAVRTPAEPAPQRAA